MIGMHAYSGPVQPGHVSPHFQGSKRFNFSRIRSKQQGSRVGLVGARVQVAFLLLAHPPCRSRTCCAADHCVSLSLGAACSMHLRVATPCETTDTAWMKIERGCHILLGVCIGQNTSLRHCGSGVGSRCTYKASSFLRRT